MLHNHSILIHSCFVVRPQSLEGIRDGLSSVIIVGGEFKEQFLSRIKFQKLMQHHDNQDKETAMMRLC